MVRKDESRDSWRRKRRGFFDDFFFGFDDEFREIEERMNEIFREISKMPRSNGAGPFIYGFSMKTGPNGEPIINEFGNIPARTGRPIISEEREPLIDVIEGDEEVTIVAELPGVEKEDINLDVGKETIGIDVNTEKRKYHKTLKLPCTVRAESAKAKYKNGVLEVKLKRIERRKEGKKRIKIE